jgi:hypothetical protein
MSDKVTVSCPHCGSNLTIDVEAGVVVDHSRPPDNREKADFDKRLQELEAQKRTAADRMAEAMRKEKSKERLMEDRFKQLMDDAKKQPDEGKPIRDIDLD